MDIASQAPTHIPPTSPLWHQALVPAGEPINLKERISLIVRDYRAQQRPGHIHRPQPYVTAQAAIRAGEARRRDLVLIQDVEDRSFARIGRGNINRLAVRHPSDVYVIVEVDCARRLRTDSLRVQTRL